MTNEDESASGSTDETERGKREFISRASTEDGPEPETAEFTTLVELLERSVEKYADDPLFGTKVEGEYEWMTYEEFGERVAGFRRALADLGIDDDETVAIISDNRVEWAIAAYATYGRGGKFCPMYEDQQSKEWEYIIEDSGAKVVIVADTEIDETVQPWTDEIDSLEHVIHLDGPTDDERSFHRLLSEGMEDPLEAKHPDRADIAGFIYTSGTTGQPKGVLLSHWNICSNIQATRDVIPITDEDVSLSFLPWAHSFGQIAELHALTSAGGALGLVESVDTILANASEVRPTLLFSVPRIFNKIYDSVQTQIRQGGFLKKKLFDWAMANSTKIREARVEGREPGWLTRKLDDTFDGLIFETVREKLGGRLRYAFSGGAALSPEVAKFIDNLHITVYEGYGLTETSPVATVNRPEKRKIGSVGLPIPGTEILIDDLDGYEEGIGEVCIRGPNVMQGYHNLPEQTDRVLDEDRTFHSGDLGRIDDDGFLWILGRVKEQYKLENGKYVVPAPIEEQLKLSPYIEQIMVEGTGCPYNVALIVVAKDALHEWAEDNDIPTDEGLLERDEVQQLYQEELNKWGEEIKSYERPKDFHLVTEEFTPENNMLTPTLKLKRRNVMKEYGDDLSALYDDAVPLSQKAAE